MKPPALQPASLYCILFARGDTTFHWTICVAVDKCNAVKMHATNRPAGQWRYEKAMHNIAESQRACVAVKLGQLASTADIDRVSNLLESIPMSVPSVDQSVESTFTCRVWLKEAIRVLAANGIISCSNVNGLMYEIKDFGDEQNGKTTRGDPFVIRNASLASVY